MEQHKPSPRRQRRPRLGSAPTIADVARLAGVSPMTVSRVINGEPNVRDATRSSVKAAIADLNYAPNSAARSLAGAGQIRIGVLYSNPSEGFLSKFLLGSLDAAARSDVQIVVERSDGEDAELDAARHLLRGGIDGVILPPPLCESSRMRAFFRDNGVPAISVPTAASTGAAMSVGIDDRKAARTMTEYIVGLGHRRVGFIAGDQNVSASQLRLDGYYDALAGAGIPRDDALVAQGCFTYRSGLEAAEQLLALADVPSAIFSSNDDMAAAAIAVAHRRGLAVPADLTVCGFDDTVLATAIWPELTTIHQPIEEMARAAVEMLTLTLRRGPDAAGIDHHRLFDAPLMTRQSAGVPRS